MALLTEHTTLSVGEPLGESSIRTEEDFFFCSGILKCHLKTKIWRIIWNDWDNWSILTWDPPKTWHQCHDAFVLKIFPHVEKKMWQAQSFCCLYEDCLRISLFVVTFPWSESRGLHGLPSKHRCEEPLVWTVIPLLKPWAEPYSTTPDAISNSTCVLPCVLALPNKRRWRMCSDPRRCCSHSPRIFHCWLNSGERSQPPHWKSDTHCTCISPGTRSGSLITKERGRRRLRTMQGCVPGEDLLKETSLSAECLSQPHAT